MRDLLRKLKNFISNLYWGKIIRFGKLEQASGIDPRCRFQNSSFIFFGKSPFIAKGAQILLYTYINGVKYSPNLEIGDYFWSRDNLTILCAGNITIGNRVSFAKDVFITNENHGIDPETVNYRDNPLGVKEVAIGDGVWIGERVCILPGVHIGKKSIIGAGSVVVKDIPEYTIAVGNPCKPVKRYDFESKAWVKIESSNEIKKEE